MRINIIGAGITGLASAYFLTKKEQHVNVFESAPEVGGLSGFFPVEGTYLEKYYHHIFSGHTDLIELIRELNIERDLMFNKVKTGFYYENKVYPFTTPKDLLLFTPLKIKDRLRLGLGSMKMMRIKDWQGMENENALDWLRKYSGAESCRIVWEPLLKMKFGDNYDRISAAWLWNRVVDRKKSREGGTGKEAIGYIKTGYKKLFIELVKKVRNQGGEIYTGATIEKIFIQNGKSLGVILNGKLIASDIVLATIPIPSFLSLVSPLPREYEARLSTVKYQGSTCVILKTKKALSNYYWINVSDPQSPFVGIIEHTNLIPPNHYGNKHLVYLTKYTSSEDQIFLKLKDDIYRSFVTYLEKIFPTFRQEDVEQFWVFQDRFSQPVFVRNYSKSMPDTKTPIKNLYLLNTAHLYPESRCLNSSITKARTLIDDIEYNNYKNRKNA